MKTTRSKDGTAIAYERLVAGPPVLTEFFAAG